MSSSDFSWLFLSSPLPSPTSVPGYQTASPAAPAHMVVEPMDWQPEGRSVAVEAWKYQRITLPALVAAGGPFELPPSYSYFPKPINWQARGEYQRLCENGGTQEQFLQWQLGLDSWYGEQLAAAEEQDKLFLEGRYWAAVQKQESLRAVVEVVRQQEAVQKEFEFRPRELREYVEREQRRADLLLRVKSRTGGLWQGAADELVVTSASSASSSSSSPSSSVGTSSSFGSSSSSSSSLASSTATVSSDSTPPPPPPTPSPPQVEVTIKPGVADQGSAFRGLSAPSVLTSSSSSSSSPESVLDLFAPAKFRGKTAGVMNEF
ncbi:hypothetical protein DL95DRAFT_466778 [Leptodontidium sp. 2 PMI_412]|nr:hypothetical protein DL95DRAFT_466778 [Leptodontidium sp. 2 PMI_412]